MKLARPGIRLSPFDRTVLSVIAATTAAILLVIWRGGQVGVAPVDAQPTTRPPKVLYTAVQGRVEQLFTVDAPVRVAGESAPAAGATPVQLTALPSGIWDFAVAPGGTQIAFSALTETGNSDLWRTQPEAAAPTLLLACPDAFCATPAWSPDGRLLAYGRRNANDFAAAAISPPRLYLLDIQAGETAPVFSDSQKLGFDPRWSFDGQWLTYLSPDLGGVGATNLESGEEQFYATSTGETGVWHPKQHLFLMSEQGQIGDRFVVHLVRVDPVTNTRTNLSGAQSLVDDGAPAWSPDGEWIAFRRNELEGERSSLSKQLWLMRADGSDARPLTIDPANDYGAPAWSPDGRTLLYHRFPLKGPEIVIAVWAMDVATGQQQLVVSPGQRPQWLP
jgi:TolB protein